ncbi:CPBP family intramembrane glutamic endopeptidase [Granulicella sp. dw_53]|uniref:CPBP family intramembrane glutamic endopeptidase n=1 Tax=Granulicella sp. dw_53 TaxID=2719792 RepID=UPI001BD3DA35|nr:CPBP family intramembrane glutamic endopeptidase [Granulicella sp. dw_53]
MPAFRTSPSPRFTRTLEFALFGTSVVWVIAAQAIAASASRGLSVRFNLPAEQNLLSSILFLFLLALGFTILQVISGRPRQLREIVGLPQRSTAREEWVVGAALGWGSVVLAVIPMALFASLRVHFFFDARSFLLVGVNLATLLVAGLAEEVAFRGYAFRRIIDAIGPVMATLITAFLFGVAHLFNPESSGISVLITMLAGILFSIAWLRTHGLWLGWGMHFAWNASMGTLFGLPVSGLRDFSTVIQTHAMGRRWLTGGGYGPEAALFTLFAVFVAIIVLLLVTREYSWNYTHPPIIPGGYPMDVAPPAAHTAMEAEAQVRPASLVQIMPTTPGTMSVPPPPRPLNSSGEETH